MLDIGCGVGDVSLLVAAMVGPKGSVVGVDRAPEAIAVAHKRAVPEGGGTVEFHLGSIDELSEGRPFDAVVGRFVLMHQADPAVTLRAAARHVRSGGLIVMIESAMSACVAGAYSSPHSPTYDRITRVITETIRAAGGDSSMGLHLGDVFERAGLASPTLWLQARVEGGPDAAIYRYMTESLRSMLPFASQLGVDDRASLNIDRLEQELRTEVVASNGVLVSPPIIAAWAPKQPEGEAQTHG